MINNLIVLGGGNAGLMAALYIKTAIPSINLTIVKSNKIGTIGVGEGSTEHWRLFADTVNISMIDLVKECGATIKIGIKFENWHGDNTSYFHSLPEFLINTDPYCSAPYTLMRLIGNGISSEKLHWDLPLQGYIKEPFTDYYQFHFDSEKLNLFLENKAKTLDIKFLIADIVDVSVDNEGFVQSIVDNNNNKYFADFFIDSSGFRRVISSRLGSTWIDWSKYLPLNSAVAFQTPSQKDIPTYTLAKAMDAGWHWRSPVQDRFGNGYVFSDAFIDEDTAVKEIQKYFPDTINIGRKINFISGKINHAWIKNCVSIGLSSNFVEPLEASSISTTIQQVRLLTGSLWNWSREDVSTSKSYNKIFDDMLFNILDFIQLHYFTKRNDTAFWKWCNNEITVTDFNKENIDLFSNNFINQILLPEDFTNRTYRLYDCLNWIQVMHGLRMFNQANILQLFKTRFSQYQEYDELQISYIPSELTEEWYSSRDALEYIKSISTNYVL